MKKYNRLFWIVILCFLLSFLFVFRMFNSDLNRDAKYYLVEINRCIDALNRLDSVEQVLQDNSYSYVTNVMYLPATTDVNDQDKLELFYHYGMTQNSLIQPWFKDGIFMGYLRFDYKEPVLSHTFLFQTCILLGSLFLIIIGILLYLKYKLIRPFILFSNMPYELAKGHLNQELEESKNRYFAKFIWGISLLRDCLNTHRVKELKLEKEKKLLLLSISHDVKTPLNTFKLQAKAIEEGILSTEEEKIQAAHQIEVHTEEINRFIQEIVKTSNEDILTIEVNHSEFYLKDLLDLVYTTYASKCRLRNMEFMIKPYSNKLVKGDMDKTYEVIENLIENAMKYGDGRFLQISTYEEDYHQLIEVYNTGEVLEEKELNHLFDSFYRGSNAQSKAGNGLGLYICKTIIHKMDGDIEGLIRCI